VTVEPSRSDSGPPFEAYEQALAALVAVPGQLSAGMSAAERTAETAGSVAEAEFQNATSRLDRLRRSAEARYADAAAGLTAQGIRLPAQVRGEVISSIDEDVLRAAVDNQAAAIAEVAAAIREASRAAANLHVDASRRAAEGQKASLALKARQERIRLEQAAEAEAVARAAAAARRRRLVVVSSAVAAAIAVVVAVLVIILTRH
jgi:hypothetical protein